MQAAYSMAVSIKRSLKWVLGCANRRPWVFPASSQVNILRHFEMDVCEIFSAVYKVAQIFQVIFPRNLVWVFRRSRAVKRLLGVHRRLPGCDSLRVCP